MPRQVDHTQRRTEIVHAVWALLAEGGIEAVTFRRVAAEAGVSVGRVQHYFESRTDLIHTSARAMIEGAGARHEALQDSPAEALRHAVVHVIPNTPTARVGASVWLSLTAASVADAGLARILTEAKRGQQADVASLIVALHGTAPDAATTQARSLIGLADGLAQRVLVGDLTAGEALASLDAALDATP